MKVGTRGSKLALTQTKQTCQDIANISGEKIEVDIIKTKGDKITDSQLYNMDSKGLFTKELDKAVLISNMNWNDLEECSSLGSSSLRREAFCKYHNKRFKFKPLRGNVETRIQKVLDGEVDGTLMAEAGLIRLGLTKYIKEEFPIDYITPAAGQGALAVISRKDSKQVNETLKKIDDYKTHQTVLAEKTVLYELGIGCQWPLGSYGQLNNENKLELYSVLLNEKGEILHKTTTTGSIKSAKELGIKVGKELIEYI